MAQKLKLNEFKVVYAQLKTKVPWLDYLLYGFLVWLEQKFIDYRVTTTVDEAIEEYEKIEDPIPDCVTPLYTETSSEASTRLPEMRLTAPWYIDTKE